MSSQLSFALVFPGQGSQTVGMLSDLAVAFPLLQETFAEASEALSLDLWALSQHGPDTELNRTENTQPALLTAGVALWRLWREQGGAVPAVMAGHSLGEYTALVCAGALSLPDAARLVAARGRFMQQAVPQGQGAMAAILGLDDAVVEAACAAVASGVVAPVNYNAPGQVVIAGAAEAVAEAIEHCKSAGAKRALPLPVSVPSHCALMRPAAEQLAALLADMPLQAPSIPVINNVDVAIEQDVVRIRDALVRQLYSPVQWVRSVQKIAADGTSLVLECGPGRVLCGLNKRIVDGVESLPLGDVASLQAALQRL